MAQGVYYNQEVTAEMLNGMAADLGHTSFNGFGNEKFGANELNKITGDLVSPGVLISGDMCRVIKDNSGNLILQTGIIVFANGAKMEITSPMIIDADAGTVIYALNDTLQGRCSIEVAKSYPTEDDFVKLCAVGANKTLTDNRVISKAKMELFTGNSSWSVDLVVPLPDDYYSYSWVETEIPKNIWNTYNYVSFLWHSNTDMKGVSFSAIYPKEKIAPPISGKNFISGYYSADYYFLRGNISEIENGNVKIRITLSVRDKNNPEKGIGGDVTIMLI